MLGLGKHSLTQPKAKKVIKKTSLRLDEDTLLVLNQIAQETNHPRSWVIRVLCQDYKIKKEQDPQYSLSLWRI